MENPNPYDDKAFLGASNSFQATAEEELIGLWESGASLRNIESEIANALDNALEGTFRVQIIEESN